MGHCHSMALKSLGIRLIGLADLNRNNAEAIANDWCEDKPNIEGSIGELLNKEIPDLVVIATTAQDHARTALQAIDAGVKYILLEKPVATSLLDCQILLQRSEKARAALAVNHQMRFLEQYKIPNTLLKSPSYGGFNSMHVAAGNFGLAMNGTHYIEAFRFLSNEEIKDVSAWFDPNILKNPRGPQFKDASGCIRVRTISGKRLYIDTSGDQGHGVQVTYMGRNGRITIDELTGSMTTVVRQPEHREAPTNRYGMPVDIEEHKIKPVELVDSTKAVLEALVRDEDYPTLHDGTLAVKTLIAAYHSHRKDGVPVQIADIPDNDPEVFPWA